MKLRITCNELSDEAKMSQIVLKSGHKASEQRTNIFLTTWGVPYQDKFVVPRYCDQRTYRFKAVYQENILSHTFVK